MTHSRRTIWKPCAALALLLVASGALSLNAGAVRVPLGELFTSDIVRLRVARILMGAVAGAGLSVSGVIFQALMRNPLAEPYVLGVSSGAGLGAAVAILLGLATLGVWTLPAMAFAGALATIGLVYTLARQRTGATPVHTLLLAGVIVGAVLNSVLMFFVTSATADKLHNVMWWLLGNLQIFDWKLLWVVTGFTGFGVLASSLFARDLNTMTLGEEPAAHLGLRVERTKFAFLLVGSLVTGAVVSGCGIIAFVGLIVPHSTRMALGPDHRRLVPASALAGACFLILADTFARTVIAPTEIPIGVVTSFLGGPFFLYLLKTRKAGFRS